MSAAKARARKSPQKRPPSTVTPRKSAEIPARAKPATVLILKTVAANRQAAYHGFIWPESGPVKALDWNPTPVCGGGLHGALWGEGDGSLFSWATDAKWIVFEAAASSVVDLKGKVKVPSGVVVFCGGRFEATKYLAEHSPPGSRSIVGGTSTSGVGGTSTSGDRGEIRIRYYCKRTNRYRVCVGYVDESGIEANTAYVVVDGKLAKKGGIK